MVKRHIEIKKPAKNIINFFYYIADNPDKYAFSTHKGIFPIKGRLTEPGAIFQTQEKFFLIPITLTLTTVKASERSFVFQLIKPLKDLEIYGKFEMEEIDQTTTKVSLSVYSQNRNVLHHILLSFIFLSPIRLLIAQQLTRELKFISLSANSQKSEYNT